MLCKVTHCTGRVLANTRPHQLRWGDREMGTAISCIKCSQVAGLIQKVGGIVSSCNCTSCSCLSFEIVIDLYPLLRNDDVWGETVGTNWNSMTCERRDRIFLSSTFPGMSAVFHCLSLSKISTVVSLCYSVVSKFDGH